MKTTKLILAAALIGTASLSAAHAGIRFGFSVNLPVPAPVVVVAPAMPVPAPAPVMVVPVAPTAVVVPACPGPDYVWTAGYWGVAGYNRVWVPGSWMYHPRPVVYVRGHDYGHDRNYGWRR